jgi:uncharacterized protein YkwD
MSTQHARGLAALALSALALASLAWCAPATLGTSAATGTAAAAGYRNASASYESKILYWTNVHRRAHDVRPLRAGTCVDRYAESWGRHLASTSSFQHQSLTPILRGCSARTAGENIAWGNVSARGTVARWMRSPGHRRNLLSRSFARLGVGAAYSGSGRLYTVQDFTG